MPLNINGYKEFSLAIPAQQAYEPRAVDVAIDPNRNNGANVLCIYSGIVVVDAKGATASKWRRGNMRFAVPTGGRQWHSDQIGRGPGWTLFKRGGVTLSLASILNLGTSNNAGWAVDAAVIEPIYTIDDKSYLVIDALLAVRDSDGYLHRLSYEAHVLGLSK